MSGVSGGSSSYETNSAAGIRPTSCQLRLFPVAPCRSERQRRRDRCSCRGECTTSLEVWLVPLASRQDEDSCSRTRRIVVGERRVDHGWSYEPNQGGDRLRLGGGWQNGNRGRYEGRTLYENCECSSR